MRLDINLASQPYEDARQFWTRWGTAVGAVGLLTLILLSLTLRDWVSARKDRQSMAQTRAMIADRDEHKANAERILNLPENRVIRDQSQLLNTLIERKAFSWTRVLESLEQVMPPRVHLVSIHPELDDDNQLGLKMTVAGDSRDRALELPRRMEDSRRFAETDILAEHNLLGTVGGDTEQLDLAAVYIPEPVAEESSPRADKSKAESKKAAKPKTETPKPGARPEIKPRPGAPLKRSQS